MVPRNVRLETRVLGDKKIPGNLCFSRCSPSVAPFQLLAYSAAPSPVHHIAPVTRDTTNIPCLLKLVKLIKFPRNQPRRHNELGKQPLSPKKLCFSRQTPFGSSNFQADMPVTGVKISMDYILSCQEGALGEKNYVRKIETHKIGMVIGTEILTPIEY